MKKLDTGRLGRGYLAGLWPGTVALILITAGKWIFEKHGAPFDSTEWNTGAVMLGAILVHGIAAWGVFRLRSWGYYLSLAISVYWLVDSVYDFFAVPLTVVPSWFSAIPFVLGAVALAWLASPALRSQFSLTFHKAKVV